MGVRASGRSLAAEKNDPAKKGGFSAGSSENSALRQGPLGQQRLQRGAGGSEHLFVSAIKGAVKAQGLPISTKIFDPAVQLSDQQLAKVKALLDEN